MKREDIIDALEYLNEEYIKEAEGTRRAEDGGREANTSAPDNAFGTGKITSFPGRIGRSRKWGTLVASLAVLVIAACILSGVLRMRGRYTDTIQNTEAAAVETEQAEQPMEEAAGAAAEEYADNAAKEFTAEAADAAEPYTAEEAAEAEAAEETTDTYAGGQAAAKALLQIRVLSDAGEVVFVLNDTSAAKSFVAQLPLHVDSEPYSDNEIVFHPGEPLDTENGKEGGGTAGYLGYFAPWNNVVMYYGDFEEYPGLYILGEAVSGAEYIQDIRGSITVEAM